MSDTASHPTKAGQPGDVPTWLTVVIVLFCVAGGGAVAWWYFDDTPKVETVAIQPGPARPNRPAMNRPPQPRPAAAVQGWNNDVRTVDNAYIGRVGNVQLRASKQENGQYSLNVRYNSGVISRTQLAFMRALGRNTALVEKLKLTPEQSEAMNKIPRSTGMVLTKEDTAQLRAAFDAFLTATPEQQPDAKKKLLEVLASLEQKNLEPTKAALTASVAAVRAILTPEQVKIIEATNAPGN